MHTGDLGDALCGFSAATVAELRGRIALIINVAGLVEFTPPVDESFKSNVDGAENVIALANACVRGGRSPRMVFVSRLCIGSQVRRRMMAQTALAFNQSPVRPRARHCGNNRSEFHKKRRGFALGTFGRAP